MIGFHGEYEATVDAKSRFLLPSALKKQLPETETTYMISKGFEKCLTLYPMNVWNALMADMQKLNQFDQEVRIFLRQFLGGATEVELDSAGRMLLPQSLKEYAGLGRDIILAATINKFEIWNAETYKAMFENFPADKFSELGKKVMGGGFNFGSLN